MNWMLYLFIRALCYDYYMIAFIHATPIYLSLAYGVLALLLSLIIFAINIALVTVTLLLLLLPIFCYCHITVATNKFYQPSTLSGVVELTTQLLRLINI